ncbi:zinc-ribbon domain-containing protein [Candidatus Bathyarchaeota archaeon]|nr:zinc-ribbon domain-containing protein [Candidatus Bathyarchaeota archaeon]
MVYCSRCGAKNEDQARVCIQCGEALYGPRPGRMRREEEMCFGLLSHWGGVFAGVVIILFGSAMLLRQLYGITFEFWPIVIVLIGILIIAGTIARGIRR